jgi:hypothetical protein
VENLLDMIIPGMLKDAASELATPLSYIMNLSLRTDVVPLKWKIAKVTPIHKSGPTSSFDNYRPISVLPILSKILELAAHKQLTEFLESNNFLSRNQFLATVKGDLQNTQRLCLPTIFGRKRTRGIL